MVVSLPCGTAMTLRVEGGHALALADLVGLRNLLDPQATYFSHCSE